MKSRVQIPLLEISSRTLGNIIKRMKARIANWDLEAQTLTTDNHESYAYHQMS